MGHTGFSGSVVFAGPFLAGLGVKGGHLGRGIGPNGVGGVQLTDTERRVINI